MYTLIKQSYANDKNHYYEIEKQTNKESIHVDGSQINFYTPNQVRI